MEDEEDFGFDSEWIIEFRQEHRKTIGLIWGGTIQATMREVG